MSPDLSFADVVRDLRAGEGVGREVIAARAEVAVNTVRNAELGQNITVENLRRVLRGLGHDLQVVALTDAEHASRLKASEAA